MKKKTCHIRNSKDPRMRTGRIYDVYQRGERVLKSVLMLDDNRYNISAECVCVLSYGNNIYINKFDSCYYNHLYDKKLEVLRFWFDNEPPDYLFQHEITFVKKTSRNIVKKIFSNRIIKLKREIGYDSSCCLCIRLVRNFKP